MKKAIKVLSIIDLVLSIGLILTTFILFFTFIAAANSSEVLRELVSQNNITEEAAKALMVGYAVTFMFLTIWQIPGLVFDIILLRHSSSDKTYSQANWIVFGVLSFVFTDTVVGILAIIYGAMQDNKKNDNVQEVNFEEK